MSLVLTMLTFTFQPNTWGFDYCDGCRECQCGLGSVTPQCGLRTGLCDCQPGVQGDKCDRCMPGHWNLGPNGCQSKSELWLMEGGQMCLCVSGVWVGEGGGGAHGAQSVTSVCLEPGA